MTGTFQVYSGSSTVGAQFVARVAHLTPLQVAQFSEAGGEVTHFIKAPASAALARGRRVVNATSGATYVCIRQHPVPDAAAGNAAWWQLQQEGTGV